MKRMKKTIEEMEMKKRLDKLQDYMKISIVDGKNVRELSSDDIIEAHRKFVAGGKNT